jgi:hypothetical protein
MTPRTCVAAVAPLIGAVWGCGASTEPDAMVSAMSPAAAFNDAAFAVSITAKAFRPVYRFDTMAASTQAEHGSFAAVLTPVGGSAADAVPLGGVIWQSPEALAATAPAGIPAGTYDVVVTDPRGGRGQLDGGFLSLGPDLHGPTVRVATPPARRLIAAGTTVTVTVVADDGDGFLVSLGATIAVMAEKHEVVCTLTPPPHQARCSYQLVAPDPTDDSATIVITPHATDTAGNQAEATAATYRLVARPTLASVSPGSGPATGGTEIVVQGAGFIEPSVDADGSHLLVDGERIPATSITPGEIRAVMPHHDPGTGLVSVANGQAETDVKLPFQFIGAPILRLAFPLNGPLSGGTRIEITGNNFRYPDTQITINDVDLACAIYMSPLRIEGVVPRGMAPGPVWIVARDEALGTVSTLPDPFVYEPTADDSPDGGVDPSSCAGSP